MQLSDVHHQPQAQARLQLAIHAGRVPHAYVFAGPSGIGKEMLAQRLAAILLCADPVESSPPAEYAGLGGPWRDACGRCIECELMAADTHPDLHRIYRGLTKFHPDKKVQRKKAIDLSIDVIRHFLIDSMGLSPARGRAKVYVVAEADTLNRHSQNAMLKTLEEPPDHSYIILITPAIHDLLETTRSRCHLVGFQTLPLGYVIERLMRDRGLSRESAVFLAELSGGSLGTALRHESLGLHAQAEVVAQLLATAPDDPLGFGKRIQDMAREFAKELEKTTRPAPAIETNAAAHAYDDKSEDDDDEAPEPAEAELCTSVLREARSLLMATVVTLLRDVQRRVVDREAVAMPSLTWSRDLARRTNTAGVRRAIRGVASAEYHMEQNVNAALLFDVMGIEVGCGLAGQAR